MLIGIIREKTQGEQRVAITPKIAERLIGSGMHILIEKEAGKAAGFSDDDFIKKGAEISDSAAEVCQKCNMLFKIWAPLRDEWQHLTHMPVILADFSRSLPPEIPFRAFALEKIPRISRAQSMDILSSQDNLAGYKAALKAIDSLTIIAPMMITAAGTLPPLSVLIWGLGVAGLQAAATAKRLGARVYASDIRPETREQAVSVGAVFLSEDEILKRLSEFGLIITSAGSYGRAPILFDKERMSLIPPQNLVFDISGNVEDNFSAPNLIRNYNIASEIPESASRLFANNLYNFFRLIYDFGSQSLNLDFKDEIIRATYMGEKKNV
uniref:proton-translocating NAD(P)(+) transhydrogenase n=1 Tax=uncultured Alphaproteobacteria bacterium TaxID=91750 RepID=A0A6M4NPF6_9PROT|nr:alanine dehydrogenase [uncultured Alphaproteobacteria bacterium]